ncbi:hypothetical protein [Derxia gummosa]|uniref:Contractile injection system tube protein N-terminal domain-containing protein n=1 Tax=Derxia gummosa DSM 723 TaxID=1121388 RepID=A0A8B6XCF8_9BURK|nr:hypothetical protein [Derxia gummosa]
MAEKVIVRAELIELKDDLTDVLPGGKRVPVQFNPETLKLAYANQTKEQNNGGAKAGNGSQGTPARQFVGAGTTKLSVQLTFDVSAASDMPFLVASGNDGSGGTKQGDATRFQVDDVRRVTADVLHFMKPKPPGKGAKDASQLTPPGVRFLWGRFLFDGIVDAIEETVEFFSADGHALRATVALTLSQQSILVPAFDPNDPGRVNRANQAPASNPLALARSGQSLQQMTDGKPGMAGAPTPGGGSGGGFGGPGGGLSAGLSGGIGGGLSGGAGLSASLRLSAQAGGSLGGFAASTGAAFGGGWQQVAAANGIENPRALAPGQFIDLSATKPRIVTG